MLSIQYILPTLGNVGNIILFFNSISFQAHIAAIEIFT